MANVRTESLPTIETEIGELTVVGLRSEGDPDRNDYYAVVRIPGGSRRKLEVSAKEFRRLEAEIVNAEPVDETPQATAPAARENRKDAAKFEVWKIDVPAYDSREFTKRLPRGAEIIKVGTQRGKPKMWALVDPAEPRETRRFHWAGTGWEIDRDRTDIEHVGTSIYDGDSKVIHIFEVV